MNKHFFTCKPYLHLLFPLNCSNSRMNWLPGIRTMQQYWKYLISNIHKLHSELFLWAWHAMHFCLTRIKTLNKCDLNFVIIMLCHLWNAIRLFRSLDEIQFPVEFTWNIWGGNGCSKAWLLAMILIRLIHIKTRCCIRFPFDFHYVEWAW